jgi:hypothetical protein
MAARSPVLLGQRQPAGVPGALTRERNRADELHARHAHPPTGTTASVPATNRTLYVFAARKPRVTTFYRRSDFLHAQLL